MHGSPQWKHDAGCAAFGGDKAPGDSEENEFDPLGFPSAGSVKRLFGARLMIQKKSSEKLLYVLQT